MDHRLRGELGFGGSVKRGERFTFYGDVRVNAAIKDIGDSYGTKATAGVRLAF
jgi:hypothetical protein